ncbi:MAG: MBL fold metallo-hydrolase [Candidatus Limnocylindria bacterium]
MHFLDVGQGDATLLVAPDATLLIDAGRHDRNDVVPLLTAAGVTELDVVAITHGHADHIGQLDSVLDSLAVAEVWMPGTSHTTQTFSRALSAIERSDAAYEEPRAGQTTTVGSLTVQVLHPASLSGDIDTDMLTLRVSYGSVSFLFTGDAEADVEAAIVSRHGSGLASTVYQVGHHGSNTSTSAEFLAAVRPQVAVYSASAGNQYGHPHDEVVTRLAGAGIDIYGTPTHGTVIVRTDGTTYSVATSRSAPVISTPPAQVVTPVPIAAPPPPPPVTGGCAPGQVDINSATYEQLQLIIHIGPVRAAEIPSLRPFGSVDDLDRVNGIASARLADIKAQGVACVG